MRGVVAGDGAGEAISGPSPAVSPSVDQRPHRGELRRSAVIQKEVIVVQVEPAGSGIVGLGNLPGGSISAAFGVSGDGSVAVGYSYFRWTNADEMIGLGDLHGGSFGSGRQCCEPRRVRAAAPPVSAVNGWRQAPFPDERSSAKD